MHNLWIYIQFGLCEYIHVNSHLMSSVQTCKCRSTMCCSLYCLFSLYDASPIWFLLFGALTALNLGSSLCNFISILAFHLSIIDLRGRYPCIPLASVTLVVFWKHLKGAHLINSQSQPTNIPLPVNARKQHVSVVFVEFLLKICRYLFLLYLTSYEAPRLGCPADVPWRKDA